MASVTEAVTPEEALEAVVVAATEEAEDLAVDLEEEVHAVDQEVVQQDPACLSDKDRSNSYEEAHHDQLPEVYEKGKDN